MTAVAVVGGQRPDLAPLGRLPGVQVVEQDAEVLVAAWCNGAMLEAALQKSPGVRWVHSLSAGVDHLLTPALVASPAVLTNGRGVFSAALAEFALAALLHFAKDLSRMEAARRARRWEPFDVEMLMGRRLLVVGYGDIGRAVAVRAHAVGMRVSAVRRSPAPGDGVADQVYGTADLRAALCAADAVVLCTPSTPGSRGMIGAPELAALPPHAVLINVGRGDVLDEAALVDALRGGRLRGAALDVFRVEPLPADSPLWGLDTVLLSPHTADHTAGWKEAAVGVFLQNLDRWQKGEPLANLVDKVRGY